MYAASDAFLAAMRGSHTAVSRLDILADSGDTTTLDVLTGSVTIDYDSTTRRSIDVTVVDEDRTFGDLEDLLDPLLAIMQPSRGVRYDDGTEELLPLGVFFPENETVADMPGVTFRITAYDASTRCQGGLDKPFYIQAGEDIDRIVPALLARKLPSLTYRLTATPFTSPALVLRAQTTPWTKAAEMYESVGYDLSIARDGVCESNPRLITAADEAVWEFVEGENATFANPSRALGAADFPNVVIVKGTNSATGTQVQGEAADMDPDSPTYRYGPTGERILEIESEKVKTNDQATAMARLILARKLGPQEEVTFDAVPNPALDVPDVVSVTRERLGLFDRHLILSKIQMPLGASDKMTVTARRSILTDTSGVPVRV